MARAAARKKTKSGKVKKASHLAKKTGSALKKTSSLTRELARKDAAKPKDKALSKAQKELTGRGPRAKSHKDSLPIGDSQARSEISHRIAVAEKPPRLLSETKSTNAALAVLERGIKLIYQKDFKKAHQELHSLLQSYPQESEILARARTYLQICEREEAARKRAVVTNDQLYTLGVMEHNRGNFAAAVATFRQLLEKGQKGDHIFYSLAASIARSGSISEALQNLRQAVALNEDNRVFAKNDSDFEQMHADSEFANLVGLIAESASEPPRS